MRFLYDRRKRGIYMRRIVHHWNTSTYLYSRVFFSLSFLLPFRSLLPLFFPSSFFLFRSDREFEKSFGESGNLGYCYYMDLCGVRIYLILEWRN